MDEDVDETIETGEDEQEENEDEEEESEQEDESDAEDEDETEETSGEDLFDGTRKLAGKFDTTGDLEKGYVNLESWANRRVSKAESELLKRGLVYDKTTDSYIPASGGITGNTGPETTQQRGTERLQEEANSDPHASLVPLEYLDEDYLAQEASDGRFGKVTAEMFGGRYVGYELDRYGAPVVPPEDWEDHFEREGVSPAGQQQILSTYRNIVNSKRLAGWERDRESLRTQAQEWEAKRGTEAEDFAKNYGLNNGFLDAPTGEAVAKVFYAQAEDAIKEAVRRKQYPQAALSQPGIVSAFAFQLIARAQGDGNFGKVLAAVRNGRTSSVTRRGTGGNDRVISTRLAPSVRTGEDVGGGDGAAVTRNGAEASVYPQLTRAQKAEISRTANALGRGKDTEFLEKLAKEVVSSGKVRVKKNV